MSVSFDRDGAETAVIHDLVDFTGMRVLEVGCGNGRLTWGYARTASSVVALDVNESKIKAAIAMCPPDLRSKLTFRVADITTFDTGDDSFDAAILSYSL